MKQEEFNYRVKRLRIDNEAFNELYIFYFPKIVEHLYIKYNNIELGLDVAQEFFTKLLTMSQIEYIKKPNSWVYTVAENMAKNIIKRDRIQTDLMDMSKVTVTDEYGYELYGEYWDKLNDLDDITRKIVIMKAVERYDYKDIAKELNIKPVTVRKKYSRGLKKLKE